MENNTELIKFQFDDNYKEIIESSSIVRDFDKFIEMANDGLLELTKNDIISSSSAVLVNETIFRKISVQLNRPVVKSFPNVLSLFILFSYSGLREDKTKGKKKYLSVNPKMQEQWKQFSDVEKYFSLFTITFTNFTFQPINERDGSFELDIILRGLANKRVVWSAKESGEYLFTMYRSKTIFITLEMLGLIDIKNAPPLENKGWDIQSIQSKKFMGNRWAKINELRSSCYFPEFGDDELEDTGLCFGDIEEIARNHRFADKITEHIPEFSQRLKIEIENRPGIYYFKAYLGNVWRTLKVDYRNSLDSLCYGILESFNFECDHLYDVTFKSLFHSNLTFNGAPDIEYAEYPTTEDILIGDLPIKINDKMEFTFDYGDNWKFSILLEKVEVVENEANEIPEIEIIEINGDAPEQYRSWD